MTDTQAEAMGNADLIAFGLAHSDPVVRALAKALDDAPDEDTIGNLESELEDLRGQVTEMEEKLHDAGVDLT